MFYFVIRNVNIKKEFPSTTNMECLQKQDHDTVPAPRPRKDADKDTSACSTLREVSTTCTRSVVSAMPKGMMEGAGWVRDGFSESAQQSKGGGPL